MKEGPDKREMKLPAWAQHELNRLRSNLRLAKEELEGKAEPEQPLRDGELHALLSISHWSGNSGRGWSIDIEDKLSGTCVVDVTISDEEFAAALGSLGARPCVMRLTPKHAGKRGENKRERVPWDGRAYPRDEAAERVALAPFEVDGWTARDGDLANSHNRNSDGTYNVVFYRYVEDE